MPLWRDRPQRGAAAFGGRSLAHVNGDGPRTTTAEAEARRREPHPSAGDAHGSPACGKGTAAEGVAYMSIAR
jgi:hypothetical protein